MLKKTIVAILIVLAMAFSLPLPHSHSQTQKADASIIAYPNADISVLWVRRNGSDPGFDYGGANVSPSYGMSYFGTNVLQVHPSYNMTDIANPALFPTDCVLYIQTYDAGYAAGIADAALTDSRIKGTYIDDFQVGWQNASNVSAIYTAIHHNDGALGYNLTLGLVVYTRNYYVQSPNTWASIEPYFDIIHFWFYPDGYPLLYPDFCGYEDAFLDLHSILPGKEYWLGIYLHYYNQGSYPDDLIYRQMAIGSRLIKEGYATRFSILENFWIQHNTPTAIIVDNFLNNELSVNYTTTWDMATGNMTMVLENFSTISPRNYTFSPTHLINVTAKNRTGNGYVLHNLRTGQDRNATVINTTDMYFILEPGESYKLSSRPLTMLAVNSRTYLTTPTSWDNRLIALNSVLNINTTLWVNNSVIRVGDKNYQNSMSNATVPSYGIIFNASDSCKVYLVNSTIEPELRIYPYYLNTTSGAATNRIFSFKNSTLACYAGTFAPIGYVTIEDSLFFQIQPNGATYFANLWVECPSRINDFRMVRSMVWNYQESNAVGIFLMPSTLWESGDFVMDNCTIAGANYGLWIDMHYSRWVHITGLSTYTTAPIGCPVATAFKEYWIEGIWNPWNSITIESNSTGWTMVASSTAPNVTFITTGLDSGMAYRALKNGTGIALGPGPVLTFAGAGAGDYQVIAVYTLQVYNLVQLIFVIIAVGVISTITYSFILPLQKRKVPTNEAVRLLINMVIYIIVACTVLEIVYMVVIG
jgi:3D (Asp-Asp-Asp) domain-containing protein